jgi:hypothetical protein
MLLAMHPGKTMRNLKGRSYVPFCVLVVLGFDLVVWLVASGPNAGSPNPAVGVASGNTEPLDVFKSFTILGNASAPISPGVMTPLDLNFANSYAVSLSVSELSVTVGEISAPSADRAHPCTVDDFTMEQASPGIEISVAAKATSTLSGLGLAPEVWPRAGMLNRSVK